MTMLSALKNTGFIFLALVAFFLMGCPAKADTSARPEGTHDRQHLVFWHNTPQEMEVYKIYGRREGPTIMIIGGIQGDEPGGFLSADLYADLALKRGNLIVVPRANFNSIIQHNRGPEGDMNRKFEGDLSQDPDRPIVECLKELMAESDLVLNLHDGSGYYRPTWENDMANPNRYGQCIISDAEVYTHPETGRVLPLGDYARAVVERVNEDISDSLQKFHFFNTNTAATDSKHKEQRKSVTYYAMTKLGIPAFGVETSKQLPSLELKVHQHNLAVNAFMELFGVEVEQPRINLAPPVLGYVVISVNGELPIAVANGQTLEVKKGDTIEVVHVGANYDRGLSVDVQGVGGFNDIRQPLKIEVPTTIVVQKDHIKFGRMNIGLLPENYAGVFPRLLGEGKVIAPRAGTPVMVAAAQKPEDGGQEPAVDTGEAGRVEPAAGAGDKGNGPAATVETPPAGKGKGGVLAFLLEVDGRPVDLAVDEQLVVSAGAKVKMVDIRSDGTLPKDTVMNLRGFVPPDKTGYNNGEDRGATADTARDMMPAFSRGGKGLVYDINAERGKTVLASASIKILVPKLESVTISFGGKTHTLKLGGRIGIPVGTPVTVQKVVLAEGMPFSKPRFTLGGRNFSAKLPQTLTMPSFAANLAVFEDGELAGKVLWFPK
ncbi:hypothetical protein C4J81_12520 [Deltaproteobacteria bacterium Smac51]|nr:hypothetical protein C4J81_12520 [Deltaproteobacteria bacterium Smac51]